jgi:hypothetical protein
MLWKDRRGGYVWTRQRTKKKGEHKISEVKEVKMWKWGGGVQPLHPLFSSSRVCCDNGEDESKRKITENWALKEREKTQE